MAGHELRMLRTHPADETKYLGVSPQGFERRIVAGKFALREHRMDLLMANAMEPDCFPAAEGPRDEVMPVDRWTRNHRPPTQTAGPELPDRVLD